jgi:hypothetical protein
MRAIFPDWRPRVPASDMRFSQARLGKKRIGTWRAAAMADV